MNTPLWNELPHKAHSNDLGMQEVQKAIVKPGQILVTMAEHMLRAKKQQNTLDPQDLQGPISDALSFIGHVGIKRH